MTSTPPDGYDQPGMLVPREQLPDTLRFCAEEGRQEVRPSLVIARTPAASAAPTDDLFGGFGLDPAPVPPTGASPYLALVWDDRRGA